MRTAILGLLVAAAVVVPLPAQRATGRGAIGRVTTDVQCAADLGTGVKSRRTFCDVLVANTPAGSVMMTIPPRTGAATLHFDLHNRFTVPALAVPALLAFARHEAMVRVIQPAGDVIGSAAVLREFRSVTDLFDQIGGGGRPGGVKAVAPGAAEAVRFTIPASVSTVGIVGVRLKVLTRAGEETFEAPGRPVAIVSNLRIQYTPAP
jgi:hypothetical protein